jgi:hypothetical protein
LAPNEIGDLLAGIFAPIAFLWLATATLIQSQELRAQRRELELTRSEYELNRTVLMAQVEETKRQAEFVGEQTAILRWDHNQRMGALAEERYLYAREWFLKLVPERLGPYAVETSSGDKVVFDLDVDWPFSRLREKVGFLQRHAAAGSLLSGPPQAILLSLIGWLQTMSNAYEEMSEDGRERFKHDTSSEVLRAFEDAALAMEGRE